MCVDQQKVPSFILVPWLHLDEKMLKETTEPRSIKICVFVVISWLYIDENIAYFTILKLWMSPPVASGLCSIMSHLLQVGQPQSNIMAESIHNYNSSLVKVTPSVWGCAMVVSSWDSWDGWLHLQILQVCDITVPHWRH